jgi:hypothetical protein
MKTTIIILFAGLFSPFCLLAQNVGVGTTDPTTTLHIKSDLHDEIAHEDDFEDNAINPPYNYTDELWFISSAESNSGSFSLKAPGIITNKCGFSYPVDIPNGRVIDISGFKHHPYVESELIIYLMYNENVVALSGLSIENTLEEWEFFDRQFFVESPIDEVRFEFVPDENYTALALYFDDIKIEYKDGHGIRIQDGQQGVGAMLVSDSLGNANWSSDFGSFLKDSSVTNELQTLSLQSDSLSISDGNAISLDDIDNQTLSYVDGVLSVSNGNYVFINPREGGP